MIALACYLGLITLLAAAAVPATAAFWQRAGYLRENYRRRKIPQSMGVAFLPVFAAAAVLAARWDLIAREKLPAVCLLVPGLCLLGLWDDLRGDDDVKGFAGHFRLFLRHRRITTGFLKAVLGFGICFAAVQLLSGFALLRFWEASLVALSANLLNLFDLRPGRALKVFFLLSLLWILCLPLEENLLLLFPFLLTALALFPYDLHAEAMLGDAGANLLGAVSGLAVVMYSGFWGQFLYFVVLLLVHLAAERISLTEFIARHPLLAYFDRLGRAD